MYISDYIHLTIFTFHITLHQPYIQYRLLCKTATIYDKIVKMKSIEYIDLVFKLDLLNWQHNESSDKMNDVI